MINVGRNKQRVQTINSNGKKIGTKCWQKWIKVVDKFWQKWTKTE